MEGTPKPHVKNIKISNLCTSTETSLLGKPKNKKQRRIKYICGSGRRSTPEALDGRPRGRADRAADTDGDDAHTLSVRSFARVSGDATTHGGRGSRRSAHAVVTLTGTAHAGGNAGRRRTCNLARTSHRMNLLVF